MRQFIFYRISRPVFNFLIIVLFTSFLTLYFIKNTETALGATGSISISGCSISSNSSTCSGKVTWSVTDAIGPTVVKQGIDEIYSGASGRDKDVTLKYGFNNLYLYDNGVYMGYAYVNITCSTGSYWNSVTCKPYPSGSIIASDCRIPANSSTCDSTVTWSTADLTSGASVRQESVQFSNAGSGSQTRTITYGNNNFYVYDGSSRLALDSASASCADRTRWSPLDSACIKVRDLESNGAPTHMSGTLVLNSTANFGGVVKNVGTEDVGAFTDKFTYCWGASCTPSVLLGAEIRHSGLTAGNSANDTASITFSEYGTLRVMHCVNTAGDFSEGRVW